jgi:translocation and assembly module TamA
MFRFSAGWGAAAALAAGCGLLCPVSASAQAQAQPPAEPDPFAELDAPLDPSAPLDPMPDIGVEWPELEDSAGTGIADAPDDAIAETESERAYLVTLAGLDPELETELRIRFAELSTLEQNRSDPANAAQIDRRAREDAELLAELLRSRGYYDALVEPRVEVAEAAGGPVRVTLEAEPGPLYRFAHVQIAGIDEAGADAAALRQAFGVAANDPVDAEKVTAAEAELRAELGRRGYAFADVGKLDVAVDHQTRTATLVLPVDPNGARQFGKIVIEGRPLFTAQHLQRVARWKPGEAFTQALVDDLRRALIATGLVSTVRPVAGAAQ